MTKLYLIRHCEGIGNVQRIFNGTTDCDISELGALQLTFLAKRFESVEVDAVYSSPLIRAQKTAHAVADSKKLPVITEPLLIELYGGVVEGRSFSESFKKYPDLADKWLHSPQDFCPEGGESMRNAYERIYKAVLKIASENRGKTVAAATHGGVIRCLLARLLYGTIEKLSSVPWCENTDVLLMEIDDGDNVKLCFYNDHSHLSEDLLPKRSKVADFVKE